ncbi:hypothetical protein NCCP2222_19320 [Sporosarcina sp. NCCP-2222]|nr:hypothetical protein NCCP2222_19320 [Sporosarcina sp. NCCP-2222]
MRCEECMQYLVSCPNCCSESFCPSCGKTESEIEEEQEDAD